MRTIYFFCLSCLLLPLLGHAQAPLAWQHGYGTATRNERGGIAVEAVGPVGGYLVAGQQLLPNTPARSQVFLVRTNNQGDTLWTRRFIPPLSLQPNPTGLAVDRQGNVLLTVSSASAPTPAASHLIKFNPTCDTVLWQNLYQPVTQPGIGGVSNIGTPYVAPDGNYVFLKSDNTYSVVSFQAHANLIKVNAMTGTEIWNFDLSQYAVSAGFGPDLFTLAGFVPYAGGVMLYLDLYNNTNQTGAEEYVFIGDNGTASRFKRRIITSSPPDNGPVFHTLRDGNIVVARRQKIYKISTAAATAGDTLWYTAVPQAYQYRDWDARAMAEDGDGNILLVGDSYLDPPNQPAFSRQIHLVRFTGRGVLNKDTLLFRSGDNFARSALLGSNSVDLVFSGFASQGIIGGEDLFLARYQGFRRLLGMRAGAGAGGAGLALAVYPNPAGGDAPVWAELPDKRGGELYVFDALGRAVGQQRVGAGQTALAVPVAGLPSGVYVLRYVPASGGPPRTARLLRE